MLKMIFKQFTIENTTIPNSSNTKNVCALIFKFIMHVFRDLTQ